MQLHFIGIIQNDHQPGRELCTANEVRAHFGILKMTVVREFMYMYAKTLAERTTPGQRLDIEEQDKQCTFHAYARTEGVCGIVVTDLDYPPLVAHRLLNKVLDDFLTAHPRPKWPDASRRPSGPDDQLIPMPELQTYLKQYQDPYQADSMLKIQQELGETKITMHKTIEAVLARGEKIDDLVAKSEGLSTQSKMFYQQAKKQNSCCVLM